MRWFVALTALLLVSTSSAVRPDSRATLVFSYYSDPSTRINRELALDFEAANPGYRVEHRVLPANTNTQHDKYVTALASGDASVDVMAIDVIWGAEFGNAGWLLPLDRHVDASTLRTFIPSTLAPVTWKGTLYALPWSCNVGTFFYRRDLLERAGFRPPRTWEDLVAQSLAIRARLPGAVDTEFVFQAARYEGLVCNFMEYLWGNGAQVFDERGNVVIDSPEAVEALTFFYDIIHRYKLSPPAVLSYQEPDSYVAFAQGEALFHRSWPYVTQVNRDPRSAVRGQVGFSRLPGKRGYAHGTLGNWNLAVNAASKNPEAAVRFVKFMTSRHPQTRITLETGLNPSLEELYRDPVILKQRPELEGLLELVRTGKPRPVTPLYPKVSSILQIDVHRALPGELPLEKALAETRWKLEELRKRYPGVPLR